MSGDVIQLKPFEGSTVTFRFDGDTSFDIDDLFDGEPIPADLTPEKLVDLLKDWFGRFPFTLIEELGMNIQIHVSIDNGAEASFL